MNPSQVNLFWVSVPHKTPAGTQSHTVLYCVAHWFRAGRPGTGWFLFLVIAYMLLFFAFCFFLESNEKVLLIIGSSTGIFDIVPSDNKWRIMPRVKIKLSSEAFSVPFPPYFSLYKQFAQTLLSTKELR